MIILPAIFLRHRITIIFFFGIALTIYFFSGCASTKEITSGFPLSSSDIIASVNMQTDSIQTFSAYGNINVQSPSMAQGAAYELTVKKPDSVRIIVEGPFGITVAKVLFTKTYFTAYNVLTNTRYDGNPSLGLRALPMMSSFPPDLLINTLTGARTFDTAFSMPDSFYATEKFYILVFLTDHGTVKFSVDPVLVKITNVKTYGMFGKLVSEERYTYRRNENGLVLPATATIFVPEKSFVLDITFDDIVVNSAIPSMTISIPADAERITVQP